jgi:uncharacterized protein (DUF1330 family)
MKAYVISDVEIVDPAAMERYRALAASTIAQYGGRYLVRGGAIETLEGDWSPQAVIVLEFPSMTRAREWYGSPEYAPAREISRTALRRRLIMVEGMPV